MQHYAPYGYPSPPASPAYDANMKCRQPQVNARSFVPATRHIPLAPEDRLGMLLEGKLQLIDILGTGAYGVVYMAMDVNTGVRYAVKCLSKFNADGTPLERRQVAYQQREIRLHYLASAHRNVVSMLKIVDDSDCIYVILEYCHEGDLFLNITERGQYVGNDELSRKVFLQILDALEHCHKLGIYHRDLKPENILVTDNGETVKLADFGLATSDERSEDYGCGSTFYMSPECLDSSARKPFYMCAPNDVWSLGVILVNLTCGRNPWKQASFQDSTYRAFSQSPDFLKTILPVTDELNDILGRIFHPNPEHRITLAELRARVMACSKLTVSPLASSSAVPEQVNPYVATAQSPEEAIVDDYDEYECDYDYDSDYDCESPLSPASTHSDEGSLTSSVSTISDLDEDDDFVVVQEPRQETSVPFDCSVQPFEPHVPQADEPMFHGQDFVPQQYTGPVPAPVSPGQMSMPPSQAVFPPPPPQQQQQQQQQQLFQHSMLCAQQPGSMQTAHPSPIPSSFPATAKSTMPFWDMVKYVQQMPAKHPHASFQAQVPVLSSFHGCF